MYLRKSQKNSSTDLNLNQKTPTLSDTLSKYNLKELLAESIREEGCNEDIIQWGVANIC